MLQYVVHARAHTHTHTLTHIFNRARDLSAIRE